MSKRRGEKGDESGPQATEAAEASTKTLLEMLMEQQRAQQEQQREQQKEELVQYQREMAELRAQHKAHKERRTAVHLPKPTLQKLGPDDDIVSGSQSSKDGQRRYGQQRWPDYRPEKRWQPMPA